MKSRLTAPRLLCLAAFAAVATWRLIHCLRMPANTTDALRHAVYGMLAADHGLQAADMPLALHNPVYALLGWFDLPFNYPPVVLYFDVMVMGLSSTLFALKLALTLLDLLSAGLIYRHTGEKWLAFLYWASPAMIWWTSREGQFESLQSFLVIAAITALGRRRALAFVLLALAIQTKLFALVMLPYFAVSSLNEKTWWRDLAAFALGFLPTGIGMFFYSPWANLALQKLKYNPYYWNFFHESIFLWNPTWLVISNQVASYALLLLLLFFLWRRQGWEQAIGPLGFLVAVKASTQGQFWYMTAMPALLLPLENRRLRFALFALLPLLDLRSLVEVLDGPRSYLVTLAGPFARIGTLTDLHFLG